MPGSGRFSPLLRVGGSGFFRKRHSFLPWSAQGRRPFEFWSLEPVHLAPHVPRVIWAQRIVALLLVAFWLPASSHVHLQHLGLIHEIHEDHHHHDQGDAQSRPS
jgi:hypothetical protein